MRKLGLAIVVGLMATPLWTMSASATACVDGGSVASYIALGSAGCTVGGVTFSSITVTPTVLGSGTVTLNDFTIINDGTEFGLALHYLANTGTTAGSEADVAWDYNVAGNLLSDVTMSLAGTATGTGSISASEVLGNGVTLSLLGAGSTSQTFSAVPNLTVIKDQFDQAGNCTSEITCNANTSVLTNSFSLTATPIPGALPLFATGLVGFWGLRKKRSKQNAAVLAA